MCECADFEDGERHLCAVCADRYRGEIEWTENPPYGEGWYWITEKLKASWRGHEWSKPRPLYVRGPVYRKVPHRLFSKHPLREPKEG